MLRGARNTAVGRDATRQVYPDYPEMFATVFSDTIAIAILGRASNADDPRALVAREVS